MNREDIIRMTEEAGLWWQEYEGRICPDRVGAGDLEKFAQLVAAHEREECAKLCDGVAQVQWGKEAADAAEMLAYDIRARNK